MFWQASWKYKKKILCINKPFFFWLFSIRWLKMKFYSTLVVLVHINTFAEPSPHDMTVFNMIFLIFLIHSLKKKPSIYILVFPTIQPVKKVQRKYHNAPISHHWRRFHPALAPICLQIFGKCGVKSHEKKTTGCWSYAYSRKYRYISLFSRSLA